ncbi:TatD family hydrolase [Streptosporangium sp. NPDC049248]|uniref:TatD family hydrolase n=1 Tax=Streptosporangium sp. NPDC049248 TaxID=3155651 RepID=UPI00341AF978
MTTSPAMYQEAMAWQHPLVTWAFGAHPADPHALAAAAGLDDRALADHLAHAPVIGEIGLDGTGATTLPQQRALLSRLLTMLHRTPRPTSLHSRRAVTETVDALRHAPPGIILHWWTGGTAATRAVLDVGCYISVNNTQARRTAFLGHLPRDRVLVETDHPYAGSAAPGDVAMTEHALAEAWGISRAQVRHQIWRNFDRLLTETASHSRQSLLIQQVCEIARAA